MQNPKQNFFSFSSEDLPSRPGSSRHKRQAVGQVVISNMRNSYDLTTALTGDSLITDDIIMSLDLVRDMHLNGTSPDDNYINETLAYNLEIRKFFKYITCIVTVTMVRKFNGVGLNKESKHYTLTVLYYAAVTAQSCEHFPLPSILLATQGLSV